MNRGFRSKRTLSDTEKIIKVLREENQKNREKISKVCEQAKEEFEDNIDYIVSEIKNQNIAIGNSNKSIYDKYKKDNEVKTSFDKFIKGFFIVVFIILGLVTIAGSFVMKETDNIIKDVNYYITHAFVISLGLLFIAIGFGFIKEKNRVYIISSLSTIIALIALIVALANSAH